MNKFSETQKALLRQIIHRTETLNRMLSEHYDRLIPMSEYHPGIDVIVTGLPKNLKDLSLLVTVQGLGKVITSTILTRYETAISMLRGAELRYFATYKDKMISSSTTQDRQFWGRTLPRLLFLLHRVNVNFKYPRRSRTTQRPRGYKDHGSMQSNDAKARGRAIPDYETEKTLRSPLTLKELAKKRAYLTEVRRIHGSEALNLKRDEAAANAEQQAEVHELVQRLRKVDKLPPVERDFDTEVKEGLNPYDQVLERTEVRDPLSELFAKSGVFADL